MAQDQKPLTETASQTAGPFVHIGLAPSVAGLQGGNDALAAPIAGPGVDGVHITITGTVRDGTGALAKDILIEVWQADSAGHYHKTGTPQGFRGWGRAITDFESGSYVIETVKPGATGASCAPHLSLWLVARGINTGLYTRVYFSDETDANEADAVLSALAASGRHNTLIAEAQTDGRYQFDIVLQGDGETVFFDL